MDKNNNIGLQTEIKKTENRLITQDQIKFAENLNLILVDSALIKEEQNPMIKEIMFANAKAQIEEILTDKILENIYKLFGDPSGVKMDKAYGNDVKKRIFIQAIMEGYSLRGNQINILGGNMYIRAQGYLTKLRSFPDFKFTFPFKHRIPVKDQTTFTTTVTTDMEWSLNGKDFRETITYPVARQEGQGNDAILGKATTKMCCWLWNKISGEETVDDSGVYTDAVEIKETKKENSITITKEEGKSEQVQTQSEPSTKISKEFQDKFDSYIGKATGKDDLNNRCSFWCNTPKAIEIGIKFSVEPFKSEQLDLTVFNSLVDKFENS